jgi:hypothetical protein
MEKSGRVRGLMLRLGQTTVIGDTKSLTHPLPSVTRMVICVTVGLTKPPLMVCETVLKAKPVGRVPTTEIV